MLVELRVENLGIIADLLLPLGEGMTVITGETGAGKTLIVDALDLLCGGRADPSSVRDGADEARVEGRFVDGDDEIVLARVVPVSRTFPRISQRASRDRRRARNPRTDVGRLARPACTPVAARPGRTASAARPLCRAVGVLRPCRARRRPDQPTPRRRRTDTRSEATIAHAHASSTWPVTRSARSTRPASTTPTRRRPSRAEEDILADAEAHRAALDVAHERLDGPIQDALGAAIAAVAVP